jgi:hypothetical protein
MTGPRPNTGKEGRPFACTLPILAITAKAVCFPSSGGSLGFILRFPRIHMALQHSCSSSRPLISALPSVTNAVMNNMWIPVWRSLAS